MLHKLGGVTTENIILTRGDYVDLLINGQVVRLGRVESTETTTHYGGWRLNVGYVMVLIVDVIEPHLIVEDVDEGDLHPWRSYIWGITKVN